jgi:hypothetical protein
LAFGLDGSEVGVALAVEVRSFGLVAELGALDPELHAAASAAMTPARTEVVIDRVLQTVSMGLLVLSQRTVLLGQAVDVLYLAH